MPHAEVPVAAITPPKPAVENPSSSNAPINEKTLRALIRSEIELAFRDQIANIAKSVITSELRRLAEEKTRHLSDD